MKPVLLLQPGRLLCYVLVMICVPGEVMVVLLMVGGGGAATCGIGFPSCWFYPVGLELAMTMPHTDVVSRFGLKLLPTVSHTADDWSDPRIHTRCDLWCDAHAAKLRNHSAQLGACTQAQLTLPVCLHTDWQSKAAQPCNRMSTVPLPPSLCRPASARLRPGRAAPARGLTLST